MLDCPDIFFCATPNVMEKGGALSNNRNSALTEFGKMQKRDQGTLLRSLATGWIAFSCSVSSLGRVQKSRDIALTDLSKTQ